VTAIFDYADTYVDRAAAADPFAATFWGVAGHDGEATDYSPDGIEARAALTRRALSDLERLVPDSDAERIARDFMRERLTAELTEHDAGERHRELRNIGSPVQNPRDVFDLMPRETDSDWETIAARLEQLPGCLAGVQATLRAGIDRGLLAARRQALVCADQAATWAGEGDTTAFFEVMVGGGPDGPLGARLQAAAGAAAAAYAGLGRFLRDEYAPRAPEADGVGPERYRVLARQWLGDDLDIETTYAWGWEELHRLESEMDRVAQKVAPGASRAAAIDLLRTDPSKAITGIANLLAFLQETTDRTIEELDGRHFDIPEPLRRVECMEAPPGGAAAMYYTPPSEDLSRPGRTWYPAMGKDTFPTWVEVSTAYHEGVPGHHLQIGIAQLSRDRLSRYQSLLGWVSGHGEGWALYAERLMDELGYLENPGYEMGFLACQIFRAMRVVVDIGMHCGLRIPAGEGEHGGEPWTWDIARPFVERYTPQPGAFAQSELERYLGMPGQAISYKVGEREWLSIREQRRQRDGAAFDLKRFHMDALQMGPMGLAQMRAELLR
jgi:uncharacterized protein (DUF885 family)